MFCVLRVACRPAFARRPPRHAPFESAAHLLFAPLMLLLLLLLFGRLLCLVGQAKRAAEPFHPHFFVGFLRLGCGCGCCNGARLATVERLAEFGLDFRRSAAASAATAAVFYFVCVS